MREFVVRRTMGLGIVLGVLLPIGCINEEDPRPFSTGDSCYPNDFQECVCEDGGMAVVGKRLCPKSGFFHDSPCVCDRSSSTGGGSGK